jgi:NAD(P)-dependent dehydrogenase (short-subunit alcohol dehydrogenase family)
VRYGFEAVRDGDSFTLTSGVLAQQPMVGSGVVSLVNAALEGFTRAAALEAPRGIGVSVVSPGWVTETLIALKMDPAPGMPASDVARAYVGAVEGKLSGAVITPGAKI